MARGGSARAWDSVRPKLGGFLYCHSRATTTLGAVGDAVNSDYVEGSWRCFTFVLEPLASIHTVPPNHWETDRGFLTPLQTLPFWAPRETSEKLLFSPAF